MSKAGDVMKALLVKLEQDVSSPQGRAAIEAVEQHVLEAGEAFGNSYLPPFLVPFAHLVEAKGNAALEALTDKGLKALSPNLVPTATPQTIQDEQGKFTYSETPATAEQLAADAEPKTK